MQLLKEFNAVGLSKLNALLAFKSVVNITGTPLDNSNYKATRKAYWSLLTDFLKEKNTVYSVNMADQKPILSGLYTIIQYGIERKEGAAIYNKEEDAWYAINGFPDDVSSMQHTDNKRIKKINESGFYWKEDLL